ncbi:Arginine--tRNA ligase [Symmachiella macrocystis]|uniref:Arginine--tRNA ligase n=1 Tax=Symmachiella macrocystis TaxID=2527985 RepID=A0A5C6BQQ8_9PLAN|nr:arginine--tRNA ligase [Symmachiella macrocystis]TWU13731.1 Arginine--tRNA ligase [Symmachiella macrocystis]
MNVLKQLRDQFESALNSYTDDAPQFAAMIKPAGDPKFGDYQANCAMPLGKQVGKNPRELAAELVASVDLDELCEPLEVAGPGFINLKLRDEWLETAVNNLVNDERLGVEPVAQPRNFIVDYSAPNVAKPMHVGHLRSTVIGAALYRILCSLGHNVVGDNHIGDWGTQFGMIIYGYKHFLDQSAYEEAPVLELSRLYRLVNQLSDYHAAATQLPQLRETLAEREATLTAAQQDADPKDKKAKKAVKQLTNQVVGLQDKIKVAESKIATVGGDATLKALADADPQIATAARNETAKLHAGDAENRALWDQFIPLCLEALQSVYDRIEIHFDKSLGESFYQPMLADVVADLQAKGIARESEAAICAFVEGFDAPFIVRKTDGAFTYATTDLATVKYRIEELKADSIIYVVDARQGEHFKLLFETVRKWGYDQTELQHVSFGTILGDDRRPFKTRSGDTVGLESLLDESIAKAYTIVSDNDDAKPNGAELDEPERRRIAEIVGLGGIKYADLHHNRDSDYVFNWDKMLATTGDTATYIQYAFARVCGILRRAEVDRESLRQSGAVIRLSHESERLLILSLLRFPEALTQAAAEYRPNYLTEYLFKTAGVFSGFFEHCPVVNAETDDLRNSRLLLCDLTARVIAQGLELLGIHTSERM